MGAGIRLLTVLAGLALLAAPESADAGKRTAQKASSCATRGFYQLLSKAADWKNPALKAWELGPEWEAKLAAVYRQPGLTDPQRIEQTYRTLMEARLANASPATRWLLKDAVADALEQRSLYSRTLGRAVGAIAGPHYNPILNRTVMPADPRLGAKRYLVAVHELEHAYQRNSNPTEMIALSTAYAKELWMIFRTPATPLLRSRVEMRAVGAQWELASRIPPEFRRKLIEELKTAPMVLGRQEEMIRGMAGVQALFTSGLVAELRTNLLKLGIREDDHGLVRLLTRFLYASRWGTQPRLLKQARAAMESAALSPEEQRHLTDFFDSFFTKRNRLLRRWRPAKTQPRDEFARNLPAEEATVFDALLHARRTTRHKSSMKGMIEESLNEILLASLENAHLSKADFVKKVAPLHSYTVEQLARSHLSLDSGWKLHLAVLSAAEVGYSVIKNEQDPAERMLARDLAWMVKLLSLPFED